MLRDVELTEGGQSRHHVLIGELKDADGVTVLNGGVVGVQILQESKEGVHFDLWKCNLKY